MAIRTVLIADNNTRLSHLLAQLLADEDEFRVLEVCTTASHALECARAQHPDVVLVSESLAGQPGVEVCQALRPTAPDAAVLLWSHDPAAQSFGPDTADAVLERGMTFRELVRAVRRARPLPRSAPDDLVGAEEALTPDVYRTSTAPVEARRPLLIDVDDPDDPDEVGRMVLSCDTCGLRLPIAISDMPVAINEARAFFRAHDRCDTSIDLTHRSSRTSPRP